MIESRQQPNGAWRFDWTKGSVLEAEDLGLDVGTAEVHITGHLLETQLYLPEDLRIPAACAGRALKYLSEAYLRSSDEEVFKYYCPYSHAGGVLLRCAAAVG